jgi:hypothetical protein
VCGRNRMENIKDELGDIARETEVIRNMVVLLAEKRREAAMSTKPAAAVTVQQSPPAVAYNAAAAEDDGAPTVFSRQMVARLMSRLDDERAQSSRLMHELDTERAERARLAVALDKSRAQPPRGPPADAEASTKRLLRTISKTMGESSVVGSAVAIEAVVGRVLALRQERDRLQASGRQLSHQFEVMRRVHKREQAFNIGLINRLRGGSSEQPAAEPVAADAMHRALQTEAPQTDGALQSAAVAAVRRERERAHPDGVGARRRPVLLAARRQRCLRLVTEIIAISPAAVWL